MINAADAIDPQVNLSPIAYQDAVVASAMACICAGVPPACAR